MRWMAWTVSEVEVGRTAVRRDFDFSRCSVAIDDEVNDDAFLPRAAGGSVSWALDSLPLLATRRM